jgi:UDP-3-O-[3-hydroxymyristoyl] glucosamine N-acyltransferase
LSFVGQSRFSNHIDTTECAVLIVSENLLEDRDYKPVIIAVEDAYISFQVLMNLYQEMQGRKTGIEEGSFFHDTAQVGEGVYIGAFTYVSEKAKIGDNTQIFPHVYIGKGVKNREKL